jgi:hypothetical protein
LEGDNKFSLGHVQFQSEEVTNVQEEDDKVLSHGEEQAYFRYTSEAGD